MEEEKHIGSVLTGRVDFFKSILTIILSIIAILALIINSTVNKVVANQVLIGQEMVRIKTIQDENTLKINSHISEKLLEEIKKWTDDNYIRKPQK